MSPRNLPTNHHLTRPRMITASYVATQYNLTHPMKQHYTLEMEKLRHRTQFSVIDLVR